MKNVCNMIVRKPPTETQADCAPGMKKVSNEIAFEK